jgi:L-rhamnose isomerase
MNVKPHEKNNQESYRLAKERYTELGVDTDQALRDLSQISLSLHCWQGDDVGGFEQVGGELGGGLAVTGNYPGKARTAGELRQDLEQTYRMIPGKHRLALHAIYGEFAGKKVDRDQVKPEHFSGWVSWAKEQKLGLDFNPTLFAHPKAASGMTLSSYDPGIRRFWIDHCIACRHIGAYMGQALGTACVTNIWIPDGYKDTPVDRKTPRSLLKDSLDEILVEPINPLWNKDAVEGKLFGIGAESYTTGSHEFYLGYAALRGILLCLDSGHFHPTESIADKLSSVLFFVPEVLLHVSRGVRWDSDHVVTLTDELQAIAQEIIRGSFQDRIHIGLDYFDASINRLAAWTIGARNALRALLLALLEPYQILREMEHSLDFTGRLALLEETKSLPFGPVWDYYCHKMDVPVGSGLLAEIRSYENTILSRRS